MACIVIVVAGMRAAQSILVPFTVAVFLAILGLPPLHWLQQRRVPTVIAVAIVLLAMIGSLALVATLVSGSINSFVQAAPRYEDRLNETIHRIDPVLQRLMGHSAPSVSSSDTTTTLTIVGPAAERENPVLRFVDSINPNAAVQLAVVVWGS